MLVQDKTFKFLKDLSAHNDRTWFEKNKPRFKEAEQNVKQLMVELEARLNLTDVIEERKLFRIYRDVRFSHDKTPYKTNFDGYFKRAGASRRGGYWVRISPGESAIGGGFYGPEKDDLKRIRKEFEFDSSRIEKITNDPTFKKMFGELRGESLKTSPKGFDSEHPAIKWLRMKQFIAARNFTDEEVLSKNFLREAVATYAAIRPFFDYFSEILTTDLNGVSTI